MKGSNELVGRGGEHIHVVASRQIDLLAFLIDKNRGERI